MLLPPVPTGLLPETFRQLPSDRQLETFRAADNQDRLRLLQTCSEAAELLSLLPVQDLYLMVKELDAEGLGEVAPWMSPTQWTGLFDLDCWQYDHFTAETARRWLEVLLDMSPGRVVDILLEIDFELLVLLLSREVTVLRSPGDIEDDEERHAALQHDGGFQLEFRDRDGAKLYGGLLQVLFKWVPDFYRYLLNALQGESPSLLEESVYQQRTGRLTDLGFADPESARRIYAWLDPERYRQERHRKMPLGLADQGIAPGFALAVAAGPGFLLDLLSEGLSEDTGWEITTLTNKVALVEQIDLGDSRALRTAGERVMETLNLALEWLSAGDAAAAGRLLQECYCEELFQLGVSLTLPLQRRARQLTAASVAAYLPADQKKFLDALCHEPQALLLVDESVDGEDQVMRAFRSREDLAQAEKRLGRIERVRELFEEGLPFTLPAPEELREDPALEGAQEEPLLSHFFLTALANQLLGRALAPKPLASADLPRLHELICADRGLRADLREEVCAWVEELVPGTRFFAAACLDLWAEEFCPIRVDHLDSRFITSLLIRQAD